jgi:hypothetical protein
MIGSLPQSVAGIRIFAQISWRDCNANEFLLLIDARTPESDVPDETVVVICAARIDKLCKADSIVASSLPEQGSTGITGDKPTECEQPRI